MTFIKGILLHNTNRLFYFYYQVKKTVSDLNEKLDCLITCCVSSLETYKALQDHIVRAQLGTSLIHE